MQHFIWVFPFCLITHLGVAYIQNVKLHEMEDYKEKILCHELHCGKAVNLG